MNAVSLRSAAAVMLSSIAHLDIVAMAARKPASAGRPCWLSFLRLAIRRSWSEPGLLVFVIDLAAALDRLGDLWVPAIDDLAAAGYRCRQRARGGQHDLAAALDGCLALAGTNGAHVDLAAAVDRSGKVWLGWKSTVGVDLAAAIDGSTAKVRRHDLDRQIVLVRTRHVAGIDVEFAVVAHRE